MSSAGPDCGTVSLVGPTSCAFTFFPDVCLHVLQHVVLGIGDFRELLETWLIETAVLAATGSVYDCVHNGLKSCECEAVPGRAAEAEQHRSRCHALCELI